MFETAAIFDVFFCSPLPMAARSKKGGGGGSGDLKLGLDKKTKRVGGIMPGPFETS